MHVHVDPCSTGDLLFLCLDSRFSYEGTHRLLDNVFSLRSNDTMEAISYLDFTYCPLVHQIRNLKIRSSELV